jgi:hypothetical protein
VTAVAEIRQKQAIIGGEKGRHAVRQEYWSITWRGPLGSASADNWYRSQEAAVSMAKECGAKEIEFPKDEVAST